MMKFMTSVINEANNQVDSLVNELDKSVSQLFNNGNEEIFDKTIQDHLKDKLTIEYLFEFLKNLNFGEGAKTPKQADLKNVLVQSMKKLRQICLDQGEPVISPLSLDL